MDPLSLSRPAGWGRPLVWTICGPLACMVIAVSFNAWLFAGMDQKAFEKAMVSAVLLPLCAGVPVFFFIALKMRDLGIANHRLSILAATDGLTACLNRNAFAAHVDRRVEIEHGAGALLIVDADRFKLINDRFGHQAGDAALGLIADTLRNTVRAGDIVGRLGGEEFGIFLPNIDRVSAGRVAERLRLAVADIAFDVEGQRYPLSVSIGGVVFDDTACFEALFRQADERLYHAKQTGRNKVCMTSYILSRAAG